MTVFNFMFIVPYRTSLIAVQTSKTQMFILIISIRT